MLEAIGLSRSTYYYELDKTDEVEERNAELSSEIIAIFNENRKRYGVRRIHHELLNRGYQVNHKRVQRIMNQLGLFGKRPKEKYHSYKGGVGKVADNIINRDFSTEKPLQKWTTDVSQFNLSWGKCYISPILDMNTNEIVSYNLSTSPNMEQIRDMLNKAFERFPSVQGLVMHSDQGWQYQHAFYRGELQKHGIIQSMSRKGNCYDNCIMETFFGRLKNEMLYGFEKDYPSFEAFSKAIADYIAFHDEEIDEKQPLTIFDPIATWKRQELQNYTARKLLCPVFEQGKLVYQCPTLPEIQQYCREQVDTLWDEMKRFEFPHRYYVDLSQKLWQAKRELLDTI